VTRNYRQMPTIKTNLTSKFRKRNIPGLVQFTSQKYRPLDPGQYLYKLVADHSMANKFTDKFIQLTYTTLMAWNMNQRGARLSKYNLFRNSLLKNRTIIKSLDKLKIEQVTDTAEIMEKVQFLFKSLQLVKKGKPKLVTFSKTLHYFLPNLLMPIDRSYTIKFFYNYPGLPKDTDQQFIMYSQIFSEFVHLSKTYDFRKHLDKNWNRSIPKIIDNVIIAYIKKNH
jgi:hypothetical protein